MGPYGPQGVGDGATDAVGAGLRAREGGGDGVRGRKRAVRGGGEPGLNHSTSPVVRFWVDGVVAKHERDDEVAGEATGRNRRRAGVR
jgi:hypothetical protein